MTSVTVLMTTYNGMPHLRASIQSLLDQTLQDWKCVIVNDGSTDSTPAYLDAIDDPRFTIVHQENTGTAGAANHGLEYCDTKFVARMDDDDISLPTRLQEQADFLESHSAVGLVGAQMAALGTGAAGGSLQLPVSHDEIMADMMAGRHGLAHSCIMMRTDHVKQVGGYWEYDLNDAWDLMIRVGEISQVANIDKVLHHYRVHEGSQNGRAMRKMRFSIEFACELARRRQAGEPPLTPESFRKVRNSRPVWTRLAEGIEIHSRLQYRQAVAEYHGSRPVRGGMRMAWAALCSPRLTLERLLRNFRAVRRTGKSTIRTTG